MKWYSKLTAKSPQQPHFLKRKPFRKKDEYNDLMLEIRSFSSFLFPFDLFKASGFKIALVLNGSKEDKSL